MNDLAVVLVTCDKYAFLWDAWHHYFKKHWNLDVPVYFLTETIRAHYPDITQINVNIPNVNKWTRRLRESVLQIPEKHLFVILEDYLFQKNISELFLELYEAFKVLDADALRISKYETNITTKPTDYIIRGKHIKKLARQSMYIISYSPNIWKKEFLLRCLHGNKNPWKSELSGVRFSVRGNHTLQLNHNVYDYICDDWFMGAVCQGETTPEGQILINNIK